MNKITVVTVRNPFDPGAREIKELSYILGEPIYHYIQTALFLAFPETEMIVSRNGAVIPDERLKTVRPDPGDFLAVCPVVGKSNDDKKVINFRENQKILTDKSKNRR